MVTQQDINKPTAYSTGDTSPEAIAWRKSQGMTNDTGSIQRSQKTAVYDDKTGQLTGYKMADGSMVDQNFNPISTAGVTDSTTGKVYRSQAAKDLADYNASKIASNQKTEDQIYADEKSRVQDQLDAIESNYQASLAEATRTNKEAAIQREGETRALTAASGLIGSPEAGNRAFQTSETNRKIQSETEKSLLAKRAEQVAAVLGKVRESADKKYEAQKKALEEGYTTAVTLEENEINKAKEDVGYLLKSGVNFDTLKEQQPEEYKYLLDTGFQGNENAFKSYYIANKPEKNFVSKTPQIQGSKATWFEFQPDGSVKAVTVDAGVNLENPDIQILQGNDGFYSYNKNTQEFKLLGGTPKGSGNNGFEFNTEALGKLTGVGLSAQDAQNIQNDLKTNSLDEVLKSPGLNDIQKNTIRTLVTGTQGKFLNPDYFGKIFTDEQLKKSAADAGLRSFWTNWETEKKNYLDYLMKIVDQYRTAGKTDEEILKLMQ